MTGPQGQEREEKFIRADAEQNPLNPSPERSSVLVIEPDPLMLTAIGAVLDMQGHRAVLARDEAMAMGAIQEGQFDLIILSISDLESGCCFARQLRGFENTADIPVIFLVPALAAEWSRELARHGGVFSMKQPVEPEALLELVDKALWLPHVAQSRNTAQNGSSPTHLSHQKDWVRL